MGFRFFKRGTRAFKLRATEPATVVASKKDVLSSLLVKGVDLLALAELMATYFVRYDSQGGDVH